MGAYVQNWSKLGPSTESHENWQKCSLCEYKPNVKHNHSEKLLEEVIHYVVSLLHVLTYLCNVGLGIFFTEYKLFNKHLLKSKISSQSRKQFGFYSLLQMLDFQCETGQNYSNQLKISNLLLTVGAKPFYGFT